MFKIQYPMIYSMLINEPDFRDWNQKDTAFTLTKEKKMKKREILEDFRIAQMTDEFNEEVKHFLEFVMLMIF